VATSEASLLDFNSPEWTALFGDSTYQYPFDEDGDDDDGSDTITFQPETPSPNAIALLKQSSQPKLPRRFPSLQLR
jgi:hypothetical protein